MHLEDDWLQITHELEYVGIIVEQIHKESAPG